MYQMQSLGPGGILVVERYTALRSSCHPSHGSSLVRAAVRYGLAGERGALHGHGAVASLPVRCEIRTGYTGYVCMWRGLQQEGCVDHTCRPALHPAGPGPPPAARTQHTPPCE